MRPGSASAGAGSGEDAMKRAGAVLTIAAALGIALLAALGACSKIAPINAPAHVSGSADFSRYVAIGTSLTAGAQSGGGIEDLHQERSYPADFARQIGMTS